MRAAEMIATHPDMRGQTARLLIAALEEALSCAQVCTSCADACLAEEMVERMRHCVRVCLDCADVCATTGIIATRRTGSNERLVAQMLSVCATACHLCAEECERHATMHDHCRICAESCRACAEACQRAIGDVGGGPSDMVVGAEGMDAGQDADVATEVSTGVEHGAMTRDDEQNDTDYMDGDTAAEEELQMVGEDELDGDDLDGDDLDGEDASDEEEDGDGDGARATPV